MIRVLSRSKAVPAGAGIAFAITLAALAVLGLAQVQTLSVGGPGRTIRVANGDIVTLRYMQSMYGVSVEEKFRIVNGKLRLFETASSGAALEYLGIERHGEGNVERDLKEFSIPRASTGNHVLTVKGIEIQLRKLNVPGPSIPVRIDQTSQLYYLLGKIL